MRHSRTKMVLALLGGLFAAGFALLPGSAVGSTRYVADHVIYDSQRQSGVDYEHIFYEPNVCIYGGFNCAIIIFDPDPVNPNGRVVARVLVAP